MQYIKFRIKLMKMFISNNEEELRLFATNLPLYCISFFSNLIWFGLVWFDSKKTKIDGSFAFSFFKT